ncbi:MAG: polyprenyl synthetase family protein [Moorellales bacterium]
MRISARLSAFAPIATELEDVREQVARELRREGHLTFGLVERALGSLDCTLPPALLILSARLYDGEARTFKALACVFQFICLATKIHFSPQGGPGLPVLVGDLLYSKFFFYLCRYQCLEFLAPLAELICRIHEGGALRWSRADWNYPACLEVIDRETALLLKEACRAGARVAGAVPEQVEALGRYGFNLGRAWGLGQRGVAPEERREFAWRAERELEVLPDRRERQALSALLQALAGPGVTVE